MSKFQAQTHIIEVDYGNLVVYNPTERFVSESSSVGNTIRWKFIKTGLLPNFSGGILKQSRCPSHNQGTSALRQMASQKKINYYLRIEIMQENDLFAAA